jgi:hypothetical protein
MTVHKNLERTLAKAVSIAESQNLGEMLLHTKPTQIPPFRYVLLGFLCTLPGIILLVMVLTSDKDATSSYTELENYILLLIPVVFLAIGCISAAAFIFYALKQNRRQILLYENGLIELQGNQIQFAKYEDLQIYQNSVKLYIEGIIPIGQVHNYSIEFPNGSRSRVDWNQGKRPVEEIIEASIYQPHVDWSQGKLPVGEIIRDLIYQHKVPGAIEALEQGEDVVLGPVRLNNQTINIGKKSLFWSEVDRVELYQGIFYVYRSGSSLFPMSIYFYKVPNAFILLALLERLGK